MAKGSAAAARQRLLEQGYRTGVAQIERQRCDTCRSSAPRAQLIGKTKHDLYCNRLMMACKAHGVCSHWRPA